MTRDNFDDQLDPRRDAADTPSGAVPDDTGRSGSPTTDNPGDGPGGPDGLDEVIRSGLRASTETVSRPTADELADSLRRRRTDGRLRARRLRYSAIGVAAALIAVVAGTALWLAGNNDEAIDLVADQPTTTGQPGPFDGYEPGWHGIDTGPVSKVYDQSITWTGHEVVVAGNVPTGRAPSGGYVYRSEAYAYDPALQTWRQLADPPLSYPAVVATDDGIVAVGQPDLRSSLSGEDWVWASLEVDPDTSAAVGSGTPQASWILHGALETAPELDVGPGPWSELPNGEPTLLWTGERVIDATHGSVLDPTGGTSAPLAMPPDLSAYPYLLSTNAVWTGDEVVLVGWNSQDGLAWDSGGATVRSVPGLPTELVPDAGPIVGSTAVGTDGRVTLLGRNHSGRTAELDVASGSWSTKPTRPKSNNENCQLNAASIAGELVAESCINIDIYTNPGVDAPFRLQGSRWISTEDPMWPARCCMDTWLDADDALIAWSSIPNPQPSGSAGSDTRGAIWIPGATGVPAGRADPDRLRSDPGCRLSKLPDLAPSLPGPFDPLPQPGVGGLPDSTDLCSRFWGAPASPNTHITQMPGRASRPPENFSVSGRYRWGPVDGGRALEFTGDPAWSAQVEGVDEAGFREFLDALLADETRTGPIQINRGWNTSAFTSVEAASDESGRTTITIHFTERVPVRMNLSQATPTERPSISGIAGKRLLFLSLNGWADPSLKTMADRDRLPIAISGDSAVVSGALAGRLENATTLEFGLAEPGPVPLTATIDQSAHELRITIG